MSDADPAPELPEECAYHLAIVADPERSNHDLNVAAKHAFVCETCRPDVSDALIARAEHT